ncbi:MAG: sulfatase [Gemmatimonadota bacterium]|nr:sulfatase [Myxococcales bacterium]MDH3428080.1 sulfatase [Gemmatimonadota bacterium]
MRAAKRTTVALAAIALAIAATTCGKPAGKPGARPNLLLITVDTLRQDHVGAYGGAVKTPTLDRLAAEGFLFVDAFAVAPTTLPSHTSLFTGSYPHRHGVRFNGTQRASADQRMLAEILSESGYSTAAFVGSAVLDGFYGLDQGFDVYDDEFGTDPSLEQEQRRAESVARPAISWLARAEAPYFVWVHLFDPHGPYDPPSPYDHDYYEGDPRSPEHRSMENIPLVFYQNLQGITDIRYPLAQYKGEIGYTDQGIGSILDAIDDRDDAAGTLVVMTADHGESLGEDQYYFDHGETLHDACMRVPLLVRAPWRGAGKVVRGPVSLVDLLPTVLSLLGLVAPGDTEGQDLTPYLDSGTVPDRMVFFETYLPTLSRRSPLFGVQTAEWKTIGNAGHAALFHHPSDPRETVNLASQNTNKLNELRAVLVRYANTRPTSGEMIQPSDEQLEKLRALGYVR